MTHSVDGRSIASTSSGIRDRRRLGAGILTALASAGTTDRTGRMPGARGIVFLALVDLLLVALHGPFMGEVASFLAALITAGALLALSLAAQRAARSDPHAPATEFARGVLLFAFGLGTLSIFAENWGFVPIGTGALILGAHAMGSLRVDGGPVSLRPGARTSLVILALYGAAVASNAHGLRGKVRMVADAGLARAIGAVGAGSQAVSTSAWNVDILASEAGGQRVREALDRTTAGRDSRVLGDALIRDSLGLSVGPTNDVAAEPLVQPTGADRTWPDWTPRGPSDPRSAVRVCDLLIRAGLDGDAGQAPILAERIHAAAARADNLLALWYWNRALELLGEELDAELVRTRLLETWTPIGGGFARLKLDVPRPDVVWVRFGPHTDETVGALLLMRKFGVPEGIDLELVRDRLYRTAPISFLHGVGDDDLLAGTGLWILAHELDIGGVPDWLRWLPGLLVAIAALVAVRIPARAGIGRSPT
ncbi:hypothetical protein [Engelhardtia mirabilis]|uniref:Uncharacterized protein n=1 Tax=Engelhardtia mirabilis TaxID=2528011 RepID=A0A518BG86_9BACT|nr:hypothetical protein Pla133_10640 [Planctomycetes bacterium Pla133]QDV00324.1 hypothetical protein Pla86_10630 [Planctomycetes bacterium Pla86]